MTTPTDPADVTDADRAKATELLTFTHRGQRVFRWSDERVTFSDDDPYYAEGVAAIAAALAAARAAERERWTTAVEGLAEELGDRQVHAVVEASHHDDDTPWRANWVGKGTAFGIATRSLRRALAGPDDTQQDGAR